MAYLRRMLLHKSSSASTRSRNSSIFATNCGCEARNASRLASSPVSSTVPSVSTMRILSSIRSLLACVPQFIPEALFMTMPPTIADFFDAGSGENILPYGARIWLTRSPTIPGSSVIVDASADTSYFSQFLPATISTESVMACPERLVPAARNVTASPALLASLSKRETSASLSERTTICGNRR